MNSVKNNGDVFSTSKPVAEEDLQAIYVAFLGHRASMSCAGRHVVGLVESVGTTRLQVRHKDGSFTVVKLSQINVAQLLHDEPQVDVLHPTKKVV